MIKQLELEGLPPIYYREDTSDHDIIAANTGKNQEYLFPEVPETSEPKVIFDVGANIGIIAVTMALLYPDAEIHAFEPEEENFSLLLKNTAEYPKVITHNVALGGSTGERDIYESDDAKNFGGFSFHPLGSDLMKPIKVKQMHVADAIRAAGGKVDLLKIDTEGSEFEILSGIEPQQLEQMTWIMGEMHGVKDHETLAILSPKFYLAFQKALRSRLFQFYAQRKKVTF